MSNKKLWVDVETSGLDPNRCCILTLAALADIDGKVVAKANIKMRIRDGAIIDDSALKINGLTREEIAEFPSQMEGWRVLKVMLDSHVNKFNKDDKFVFCAYNADFDDRFLRALFLDCHDKYYGSYFFWPKIDVQTLLAIEIANGLRLPKYNLATVCEHYEIELIAHEALSDIIATRDLYKVLGRKFYE